MHAVNGLLQEQIFSVKKMNQICKELAPNKILNPHKSPLQTGNWDVNVLMKCLEMQCVEVEWFDARKVKQLDLENMDTSTHEFVGFILNISQKAFKMVKRRHWVAIKPINGTYYNLDSKLKEPREYADTTELRSSLVLALSENDGQLFICKRKKTAQTMNATIKW